MELTWAGEPLANVPPLPIRSAPDGGLSVIGVPGFEQFQLLDLEAERRDGEPVLTRLSIQPLPGATAGITPELLAGLPTRNIAALVLAEQEGAPWIEAARRLEPSIRPRGGSDEFSQEVVDVVRTARLRSQPSVEAVAERWNISTDRANQWISEARKRLGADVLPDGRTTRHQRPEQRRFAAPARQATAVSPAQQLERARARSRRIHTEESK